jgi:4-alpha-glucanotransferase
MNAVQELARLYGVADAYVDYRAQPREVSLQSQAAILAAIGIDAADEQAAAAAIHQHETVRWMRLLPPVVVVEVGEPLVVPVSVPLELDATWLEWRIKFEDGKQRRGVARLDKLKVIEEGSAEDRAYRRLSLQLPDLPLGYHTATIALDTGLSGELRLVVAHAQCYEPPAITAGAREWGIAAQLYALRSPRNWGIGDFRDLRELVRHAAPLGCGIVGLNPLHALMPANPAHISPYSPSNRQFLNVLYISVEDVPDYAECDEARERVTKADFQAELQRLRTTINVDYVGVAAAKFEVLKLLYASFRRNHLDPGSERAQAFRSFVETQGEALRLHAIYDALDAHLRLQGPQYWGWPSWPEDYRDPASLIVNRFARERVQDVEYFLYLQWLAAEQLLEAQASARELGMAIGLYGDVAVGANSAGSETWSNRHLYRQGASVGAPPDALALKGQDWGIPPQDPNELRLQQYQPFVGLIRNNMRYFAALRLDHVMSLYRLWWVPRGLLSKDGTYVHYPLEDLIAIMALESERNECLVIGEDLGTVPEAMTVAMEHYRAYHYKVLLFEQEPSGKFKPPGAYVPTALAVVTTHDLPTLRGWWEEGDLILRDRLDLYPSVDFKMQAHATRASERRELLLALVAENLWRWSPEQPLPSYSAALSRAVHAFLGLSRANVAMIQVEDLIGMGDPVNVPGTDTEHPNWQRKVTQDTADIFGRAEVRDILAAVNSARRGVNPNT